MWRDRDLAVVERKYRKVFREYIGAQGQGVTFDDVVRHYYDPNVDHFDLILAFAIDYHATSRQPTDGNFTAFWDKTHLTPEAVAAFKGERSNVRVMLSIGGDTVEGDEQAPVLFTPATPNKDRAYADRWIGNAVASLVALMREYHLDGIDVNYERFEVVSAGKVETFVYCIKALLQGLKKVFPNMVTSIAPFYDPKVQANYQALWKSCSNENLIDYVNFQFYSGDKKKWMDSGAGAYDAVYDEQVGNYPGAKVLASFKTAKADANSYWLDAQIALPLLKWVHKKNKLPGIFIWSADSSYYEDNSQPEHHNNRFRHEKHALSILNSPPYMVPGEC
ncbi:unnamed protein product [Alopecurus aequalis]